jgi:peptidoglycan/xylan/chitin deacetylase (PgdA/CDA1 family)
MYHRIAEDSFDPWGMAVTPAHFREQLEWLSANRTVIRLEDFAERHRRGKLPANAVAITFDDGYACAASVAAPLLEKCRIAATIFLPFDLIEQRRAFWWDELQEIVLGHASSTLRVRGDTVAIGDADSSDRQWSPGEPARTPRHKAFEEMLDHMVPMKPVDLQKTMDELRSQASRVAQVPPGKQPITPEQARALTRDYVEIGSHSLTHPTLTSLTEAEQRREIDESIERGRAMTGSAPKTFAYPFGTFDAQSQRLVEEAGFSCACATRNAGVSRKARWSNLPRLQVRDWDAAALQRELSRVHVA